ncbi:MAG: hypothetical protein WAZ60_23845 [Desulfosalsimonadaceae bacterium]
MSEQTTLPLDQSRHPRILAAMIARIDRELARPGNVRKDEIRVVIERARREVKQTEEKERMG